MAAEPGDAPEPVAVSAEPVRFWNDPYGRLIQISWPSFLALVGLAYVAIHLLFAGLYLLDADGIGGLDAAMALPLQAFFFSVETMATIGYGVLHPSSHWVHGVMTLEALTGLIVLALITGLAFARFERAPHGVVFAEQIRLEPVQGQPSLLIDLCHTRPSTLYDVRLRAFWCEAGASALVRHWPLPLEHPDGLPLQGELRVQHRLDPDGPLAALLRPDSGLPPDSGELLLCIRAIDSVLERPVHASHRYGPEQMLRA